MNQSGDVDRTVDASRRSGLLAAAARRPRLVVAAVVALGAGLGWVWLAAMIAPMLATTDMATLGPGMGLFNRLNGFAGLPAEVRAALAALCAPSDLAWSPADWVRVAAMWVAMVAAMMLPTAIPVLAAYGDHAAHRARQGEPVHGPALLALGYLAVWGGYAVAATVAQGLLVEARLLTPGGAAASLVFAGTTTIAAGLYQFTPLKLACLARCRAPRTDFTGEPIDRAATVFRLGLWAGVDCLGCCWALMGVMFVVGVMNVVWIVGLGAVMAAEKLIPSDRFGRAIGLGLVAWGGAMLAASPVGHAILARFW